jgi:hypothetical protein
MFRKRIAHELVEGQAVPRVARRQGGGTVAESVTAWTGVLLADEFGGCYADAAAMTAVQLDKMTAPVSLGHQREFFAVEHCGPS